jgi:hypothetical protein
MHSSFCLLESSAPRNLVNAEPARQHLTRPVQALAERGGTDAADGRGVGRRETLDGNQQQHLAIGRRQSREGSLQLPIPFARGARP